MMKLSGSARGSPITITLICDVCALADPVMGPQILESFPAVLIKWLATGIPPAIEIDDGKD